MQRRRRRRSKRTKRKFVTALVVASLIAAAAIWTSIIVDRREEATVFGDASPALITSLASSSGSPKNLIFFLGNGYGIVPMTAARIHATGEDGELAIDRFPETAFVKTYSNDAQVADGAAAMSAYMTGVKANNRVVSSTADTRAVDANGRAHAADGDSKCPLTGNGGPATTLLELAKSAGLATGVVTTARVTHAGPAATYAHLCHSDAENAIATQLAVGGAGYNSKLGDGVDVVFGGGWQNFVPKGDARGSTRNDSRDLIAEMRAKGYGFVATRVELIAATHSANKLLGLFNRSHLNYELDRIGTIEPNLTEMTTKAIDILQKNPRGYFLMVEGGRIGHALDATLARKALQDAKAFDDAIAAAIAKVRIIDPDLRNTLVVVAANHDHSLVMNGNAARSGKTSDTSAGILGLLRDVAEPGKPAVDADGAPFTTLVFGTGETRVKGSRASAPSLTDAAVFAANYRQEAAVPMTPGGVASGGADVFLGAMGWNANRFHGVIDNTRVFELLKDSVGL